MITQDTTRPPNVEGIQEDPTEEELMNAGAQAILESYKLVAKLDERFTKLESRVKELEDIKSIF